MAAAPVVDRPTRALQAYVPRLAIEWLRDHPDQRHHVVEGSLAFVDISGFTSLTERLARIGRAGPEELSDILDWTFGSLLLGAWTDGADLVKWGGDAVLLLFRGDDHAARAARASYRMQRILRGAGRTRASAGQVILRMSVGIHSGRFDFYLAGDPAVHRELIISGPGASTTAQMEAIAQAGQVVVSDTTAALLHPASTSVSAAGGHLLRSAPVLEDLPAPDIDADVDVRVLLPGPVREHLLAAGGASEHRPVAVAFVQFSGTDALIGADGGSAVDAFEDLVRNVQDACLTHGVSFLESDINRDGGKFMLAAGAPRSNGDDDDDRLLRAVQLAVGRAGLLPLRAGANRGRVFAGDFGPAFRRTYSIKGDAINVAARVMGKAPAGTLLATVEVAARARTSFTSEPVPPFIVKGKSKPLHAVLLGPPERGPEPRVDGADGAFVGRDGELGILRECLDVARARHGSMIEIVAEPGMGKSRLVHEIVRDASDLAVAVAPSDAYGSMAPYFAFRHLVRHLLGIADVEDPEQIAARVVAWVGARAPHLTAWMPLLGSVLDADLPSTRETRELDERFRRTRLEEVLIELLAAALPNPSLLIFENTHLMDEASAQLLRRIEAGLADRPWTVLATRRDLPTGFLAARAGANDRSIFLGPIDDAFALDLLSAATLTTPLSEHTMKAIAAKAGGNPLFLRALVTAATRTGMAAELPDSIEAVLTSEVDQLAPDDRTVLRCAAVLGVQFPESMLREMLLDSGIGASDADLDRLTGFLLRDGDGMWRFRHDLVREVAYTGLPFRLRRRLHEHAGRVLESAATNMEEISERLSMHYFHAGDLERAWRYSRMAGRRAQSQYAYAAAIEFFERALEAGRGGRAAPDELAEVLETLGDVSDVAGFSRDAVAAFRRARPYRRDDPIGRATLMLKEAGIRQRLGEFVTSLRLLAHARGLLRETPGAVAQSVRSRLATRYSFGKYLQHDYAAAVRWSEVGVREARASGDDDALAYAYNTRHTACIHAGVTEDEPYGELALATYESIGDLRMQAHCLNNLAIGAMQEGWWNRSAELLDRAAGIFRRLGDTANEANALYNRADLLIRQRRFAAARPLLDAAVRAATVVDDRELVALATREGGRARAGLEEYDDALKAFEGARGIFEELGLAEELITLEEAVADCLLASGGLDGAISRADSALARAGELHLDSALGALHRVRGAALLAARRYADAGAAFEAGLASPDSGDGRREYALNLLGVADVAAQTGAAGGVQAAKEARMILDRLGVLTGAPTAQS